MACPALAYPQIDVQHLYKAIDLVNHLALELDIDAAMHSVRQVASELLECEKVTLFLVIEDRRELRAKIHDEITDVIVVKFGEGIAGIVAETGQLMNIVDAHQHPLFNPAFDNATQFVTKNILCCAIRDSTGKCMGVLQALNKRSGAFTAADEQQIQLFGVHLGNTLSKSRFYEEAKREKQRLATLSNCFRHLSAVTSLNSALDTIASAVKELVCAQHVVVLLNDAARQTLWCRISISRPGCPASTKLFRALVGQGMIGSAAAHKQQVAVSIMEQPDQVDKQVLQLHQLLGGSQLTDVLLQPVLDAGTDTCLAVLCVLNKREPPGGNIFFESSFTLSDCTALSVFSMEVADQLSARALEASFASALSVVTGTGSSSAQEQLSSMLMAQLLDYGPQRMASSELVPEQQRPGLLQHSATMGAGSRWQRFKGAGGQSDDGRSISAAGGLQGLRRFASTLALPEHSRDTSLVPHSGSNSGPLPAEPLKPAAAQLLLPALSLHHQLPCGRAAPGSVKPHLLNWELDCTQLSVDQLVCLAYDLFMCSGVLQELGLQEHELSTFLSAVASHYHASVPYHNLSHAVQVLHTVWMFLETTTARNVLSAGEELVLLIAALCHDLDHDGFTNSFHINSQTELAQRYNDIHVQENHHTALTFALLRKRGANLLRPFTDRAEYQAARRLLVELILSTDMHCHFQLTQELHSHGLVFMADEEGDRMLLIKAMLHAADISNPIRPFPLAQLFAERVHTEFRRQVEKEQQLGLPVAPHMSAGDDAATWAKLEVQFIDYVAGPLWERLGQIFAPALQQPINTMRQNRAKFMVVAGVGTDSPSTSPDGSSSSSNSVSSSSTQGSSGSACTSHFTGSNRVPRVPTAGNSTAQAQLARQQVHCGWNQPGCGDVAATAEGMAGAAVTSAFTQESGKALVVQDDDLQG